MSYPTDTTQAATCDALLIKSNRIYREIEKVYRHIIEDLSGSKPEHLQLVTDSLNTLYKNAHTIDDMITISLGQNTTFSEATKMLLGQRGALLASLHQTNRYLTQKAGNVKALLRHEITIMSKNRTALNGYKNFDTENRSIIRHSF